MSYLDPEELRTIFSAREEIDPQQHIIVHYRMVPNKNFSLEEAAARTCIITSLRTITPLPYEPTPVRIQEMGRIVSLQDNGEVEIAFPLSICSVNEGLTQLLVISAFGADFSYTDAIWVDDIELPKNFVGRYRGPKFGIEGLRALFGIPSRAIVAVSLKPRYGVPLSKIATACHECLSGGADFIVDDLLLVDPDGEMAFTKRVPLLSKIARETNKQYFVNVSTSPFRAVKLAEIAKAEGASGLVVNAFIMGISAIEELSSMFDMPIINANMGDGLLTRPDQPNGLSACITSKLCRLAGADAIHAGTSSSECFGPEAWGPAILALRSRNNPYQNLQGCFAVAEGDVTIADVWANIFSLGPDVILEICSGILEYPGGPYKGAQAFRTLVENLSHRMSPREAHNKIMEIANRDSVVREGLEHYGYQPPKDL